MKIYIAGPIAGMVNGNRYVFDKFERLIHAAGHTPVNPQKVDHSHPGECFGEVVPRLAGEDEERHEGIAHRYGCYMKADIRALMECNAAVFLAGWEKSRGASVERKVAEICGLQIIEYWQMETIKP